MKKTYRKPILFAAILVLLSLSLTACSTGSAKFPTGKFVSNSNQDNWYVFDKDMTWSYYMGGLMAAKGSYQVDGNLWIEQGARGECPFPGTYQWSFDGKTLSFQLSGSDSCAPRKEATDGQSFQLSK